jgi:8-amino-7-oxononanoate synthase
MIVGACHKAWELIKSLDQSRIELAAKAKYLRATLKSLGFNIGTSSTNIIPIILGSEQAVIKAKNNLLDQKIIVSAIRPPTVPHKTSRLRIALNLNHTNNHIEQLISALKFICP